MMKFDILGNGPKSIGAEGRKTEPETNTIPGQQLWGRRKGKGFTQ